MYICIYIPYDILVSRAWRRLYINANMFMFFVSSFPPFFISMCSSFQPTVLRRWRETLDGRLFHTAVGYSQYMYIFGGLVRHKETLALHVSADMGVFDAKNSMMYAVQKLTNYWPQARAAHTGVSNKVRGTVHVRI